MRFPGLPRLPVSRRRHEAGRNNIRSIPTWRGKRWWREHAEAIWGQYVEAAGQRDEARARVVELEQAIREHRHRFGWASFDSHDEQLYAVLDGHDRQERGPASDAIGRRPWVRLREADGDH